MRSVVRVRIRIAAK